jgi:hypothetical protein
MSFIEALLIWSQRKRFYLDSAFEFVERMDATVGFELPSDGIDAALGFEHPIDGIGPVLGSRDNKS